MTEQQAIEALHALPRLPRSGASLERMQALLDHLGLAAADCVAVGDGPNDAGMLALAGRSYCMADGMKTAKAAAKALAPAAAPDGIAQLCRSLWPEIFR